MNNYATTAETAAIASDVETLSGDVATKVDKVNTTASTSGRKFPTWNSQGQVTGATSTAYPRSLSINGVTKTMVQETNSDFAGIYAPTAVGTKDAVLLSNGSGAPVWASYKFVFLTQTEYDALTTKDATTIYFITGD